MAVINEAELKRQIAEGAFARLYVVCGSEDFLKQHYAALLCERAVDEAFRDFNFHRFEGKDTDLNEIAQAMEAVPLGGGRSCVMVRDYPLEGVAGDPDWLRFLRELPEHGLLVFWMNTAEFRPKKSKALLEAIEAAGHVAEFNRPDMAQLTRILASGAKKRGCQMDRATAEYFTQTVGGELNTLYNEMDKLCAYAGGGGLTRAQIDAVCVKSVDAKSFDMVKAVAAGDGGRAIRLLDELFQQKIAPQMLLGSLIAHYVDMFRAAVAKQSRRRSEELAKIFDYKGSKVYRLKNAGAMAERIKMPQILRCLELLDDADRRLKSSGLDNRLVMEQCIFSLLSVRA
ncbi:MAG: DNA polymerase III subunit delta [Oscillospiraceae bacterium]|nr:DNA polymerase III subunit delta [Oscillospiraceae bacterium]